MKGIAESTGNQMDFFAYLQKLAAFLFCDCRAAHKLLDPFYFRAAFHYSITYDKQAIIFFTTCKQQVKIVYELDRQQAVLRMCKALA